MIPLLSPPSHLFPLSSLPPFFSIFSIFSLSLPTRYNPRFRLYITTSHPHPTFHADVLDSVSVVNFAVTSQVVNERLLGITMDTFHPGLEKVRSEAKLQQFLDTRKLQESEEQLLKVLVESSAGLVLADVEVDAVEALSGTCGDEHAPLPIGI